jgi:hypothetical protein
MEHTAGLPTVSALYQLVFIIWRASKFAGRVASFDALAGTEQQMQMHACVNAGMHDMLDLHAHSSYHSTTVSFAVSSCCKCVTYEVYPP